MDKLDEKHDIVLEFKNITKSFPGVKALNNVSFSIRRGTVHALVGENGAGKSTLMKILNGLYQADAGSIYLDGKKINIKNSLEAREHGIAMVHQELNVVKELSIAENVFLGKEPTKRYNFIDHKKLYEESLDFLREQKLNHNPRTKMKELSVGEQQMIEIIKTVYFNSKIIIMDEPTSSLSESEVNKLFEKIKELKKDGVTIIYISHRLEEIDYICDDLTILRDGEYITTAKVGDITRDQIISYMVGRSIENTYPKIEVDIGDEILKVEGLSNNKISDISFNVSKGEIVGFSGLVGAGRTEVARALFGLDKIESGQIFLESKKINIKSPRDAIENGIMMVSEDRRRFGLVTIRNILENISLPNYDLYSSSMFLNHKKEKKHGEEIFNKLQIKAPSLKTQVASLSGGNQQKIVIGKWLVSDPKIFILDEPTRGIDVGAKNEIYKLMGEFAQRGMAIIMISSDLPELIGVADRVYVMNQGRISKELHRSNLSQEKIMSYSTN